VFWAVLSASCGSLFVLEAPGGFTLRLIEVGWLVAVVHVADLMVQRRTVPIKRLPPMIYASYWGYFGALVALPFLGVFAYQLPMWHIKSGLRFAVISTLVYLLFAASPSKRAIVHAFETGLAIAVILNLFYSLLQQLAFAGVIPSGILPHHYLEPYLLGADFHSKWRASGLFINMNQLGWFGVTSGTVFLGLGLTQGDRKKIILALCGFALPLLANSRTALVSEIVSLLFLGSVFVLVNRQTYAARWFGVLFPTGIMGFILVYKLPVFDRTSRGFSIFTRGIESDTSLAVRVGDLWLRGLNVFDEFRWGYGGDVSIPAGGAIDSAWLAHLAQGGIVLVFVFALFLLATMFYGFGVSLRVRSGYGIALMCLAVTIGIGSIALSPFSSPVVLIIYLMTLFLTVNDDRQQKNAQRCS
jgi:hypothetical protein